MNRFVTAGVALLLSACAHHAHPSLGEEPPVAVAVATAHEQPWVALYRASGTVRGRNTFVVAAKTTGYVRAVRVRSGDVVKAGQSLDRLAPALPDDRPGRQLHDAAPRGAARAREVRARRRCRRRGAHGIPRRRRIDGLSLKPTEPMEPRSPDAEDFDGLLEFLQRLPIDPPTNVYSAPPPVREAAIFAAVEEIRA